MLFIYFLGSVHIAQSKPNQPNGFVVLVPLDELLTPRYTSQNVNFTNTILNSHDITVDDPKLYFLQIQKRHLMHTV